MHSSYSSDSEKEGELLLYIAKTKQLRNWIEQICREPFITEDIGLALRDSKLLCKLINSIRPGSIDSVNFNMKEIPAEKAIQNLEEVIEQLRNLGVPSDILFSAEDVYEGRNIEDVLDCLLYLKQLVMNDGESHSVKSSKKKPTLKQKPITKPQKPTKESLKWFWIPKLSWIVGPFVIGVMLACGEKLGRRTFEEISGIRIKQ